MQFEFCEVIDASPAPGFETIGNGFGDVKVARPLMGMGGSSEGATRSSLAVAVKTTATPVPPLKGGVQASAHPTAPRTGTGE